jgi:uncharacterized radical SAM protein YgiQ
MIPQPPFLPVSKKEAGRLGISEFDIILVTGDAYVDHPSFGVALVGRVLWDAGYTVGIIAQPDKKSDRNFTVLGAPRLFFGVASGNVDSMVNNLTPNLKRRSEDVYSPGGIPQRPDRATLVYSDRIHALFPDVPIVLGGIEASLRRFAHYDYWQDRVRQSILADAPADLLIFGMGEHQVCEVARQIDEGKPADRIRDVSGTAYKMEIAAWRGSPLEGIIELPSFSEVSDDKTAYARAFALHYAEQDPVRGRAIAQLHPKTVIIQNPPARPLTSQDLDHIYELPFSRRAHPSYRLPIPALEPVQFSIISHRGCFGGCSFCALTHHQGRIIQNRSVESVEREVEIMAKMPEFKGIVQDVGGPTANMYGLFCPQWEERGTCPDKRCTPACPNLSTSHARQLEVLRRLRKIPKVRNVFVSSGIRYDLVPHDDTAYLFELCENHISGHLKVAPEHISPDVTSCMNKPDGEVFEAFRKRFEKIQQGKRKRQYLLPYFMSGHPGCTVTDMIDLALYIRDHNLYTEQVQEFTPTPMSVSTCMYYTGLNPFTLEPVHVPKGREKKVQRAMLQYRDPKNRSLIDEGLKVAGRKERI